MKFKKANPLLVVFMILPMFILMSILDDAIITTYFVDLPEDICYYHTHPVPEWVDLYYLNNDEHTEFPYTGRHMLILFVASIISSYFASRLVLTILAKYFKKIDIP
jgi:hypothetical protein